MSATPSGASKWVICRICLKPSANEMQKICLDWVEKIEQCGGISLNASDDLPDSMCNKCELLLRASHKFRVLCQRSQEQLQLLLDVPPAPTMEHESPAERCDSDAGEDGEHKFIVKKEEQDTDAEAEAVAQYYSDDGGGQCEPYENVVDEEEEGEEAEDVQQEWVDESKVDYNDADICADMIMEELEEEELQGQIECEYIELPHDQIGYPQDDSQNHVSDEMSNISYVTDQHYQIVHESIDEATNSRNSYDDTVSSHSAPQSLIKLQPSDGGNTRKRPHQQQSASEDSDSTKLNDGAAALVNEQFQVVAASVPAVRKRRGLRMKCQTAAEKNKPDSEQVSERSEPQTFICCHCGNIYYERAKLTLHMKNHQTDKEKPHECEICHKRFTQTPQLARHMNSHTGSRPFKCKFCPASFADPSTCIKHQRIHTKERPYKCDTCGKSFTYSNVLKVHMMIHTGEKPFSCMHCDKKFSQLHHKKTHERSHRVEHVFRMDERMDEDNLYSQ